MKAFYTLTLLLGILGTSSPTLAVTIFDKDDWKIMLSGFVEADASHDSTRSFSEAFGNAAVAKPGTLSGDNGRTQFSNRNSRLGFAVHAPTQNEWKSKGLLEFDFTGYQPTIGTSNPNMSEASYYQNPSPRLRLAFVTLENQSWQLTAGQTWSLFGWQPFYFPAIVSVSPGPGELFQRNLQFLALNSFTFAADNKLQLAVSAERPSQRDSQMPNLVLGARLSFESVQSAYASTYGNAGIQPLSVGLSAVFKQFTTPLSATQADGQKHYNSAGAAVNFLIPLISAKTKEIDHNLTLTGEFTSGTGYADALPNWNGGLTGFASGGSAGNAGDKTNLDAGHAGFDSNGDFHLVKFQTWNAALQYHFPSEFRAFANIGYAETFSSNVGDLTASALSAAAVYDRSQFYFFNVIKDATDQIRLGVEYDQIKTHYFSGQSSARNERFQLTALFRF